MNEVEVQVVHPACYEPAIYDSLASLHRIFKNGVRFASAPPRTQEQLIDAHGETPNPGGETAS